MCENKFVCKHAAINYDMLALGKLAKYIIQNSLLGYCMR